MLRVMCKGIATIPSIALGHWNSGALFTVRYELKLYILLNELGYSKENNRNWTKSKLSFTFYRISSKYM